MTPPGAPKDGTANHGELPPAVSVCLVVMQNRPEFLAAARALRQGTKGMMVQARKRREGEVSSGQPVPTDALRVGYTCSKKVGNAVARNRAKRRLREVARAVLPDHGTPGWDYVLIGRKDATAGRPFEDLKGDLVYALKKLHGQG